jgi:hypothetical protein
LYIKNIWQIWTAEKNGGEDHLPLPLFDALARSRERATPGYQPQVESVYLVDIVSQAISEARPSIKWFFHLSVQPLRASEFARLPWQLVQTVVSGSSTSGSPPTFPFCNSSAMSIISRELRPL